MTDRVVKVSIVAQVNSYLDGLDKVTKATEKSRIEADKLARQLETQRKTFNAVGFGMIAAGGLVAAGLALAAKKAADFEAQMAQVKTLSGATASEMNGLRDAALHLGQGIGQSASDVADAETELVKAGIGVKDQLGGALKGTLDLAAAGQMNVADATTIAAAAMTQFKLAGKDVPHIADLLAAGADKALGSVSDLGQGLKFVGPVAQSMGISIEQTVGALSLFAQNGILGEQAGTGLRGVLLSLTSPSKLAQKAMDEYGLTLYDASGKFIGLAGLAQQLKVHLGGLDQATRNQALGQIFGNQQITEATILMKGGAREVENWTNAVNDSGFAAKQASGKMDSLKGDLAKLSAAWDSAMIGIGESSQSGLRGITQSITGMLSGFNSLSGPAKDAVFGVGAVGSAIAVAGGLALIAVPKFAALKIALVELGVPTSTVSASFSTMGTSLKLIPYAAAAAGLSQLGGQMADAALQASGLQKTVDGLKKSFKSVGIKQTIDDALGAGGSIALRNATSLGALSDAVNTFRAWGDQIGSIIPQTKVFNSVTPGMLENLKSIDKELAANVQSGDTETAADKFKYLSSMTDGSKDSIGKLKSILPEYSAAIKDVKSASEDAAKGTKTASQAYVDEASNVDDLNGKLGTLIDSINKINGVGQDAITKNNDYKDAVAKVDEVISKANSPQDPGAVNASASAASRLKIAQEKLNELRQKGITTGSRYAAAELAVYEAQQKADEASAKLKDSTGGYVLTLDQSTQAGRDNTDLLVEMAKQSQEAAKAQFDLDGDTGKYRQTLEDGRQSLIDHAQQLGDNAGQAKDLADKIYSIPSDTQWHMIADTTIAAQQIEAFINNTKSQFMKLGTLTVSKSGQFGLVYQNGAGTPKFNADGGLYESHSAEIASAGAWRVWAEPETGGESYIPLALAKRARSEAILSRTAALFGGQYIRGFADGGFTRPQYAQPTVRHVGTAAHSGMTATVNQTFVVPEGPSAEQIARLAAEKTNFVLRG